VEVVVEDMSGKHLHTHTQGGALYPFKAVEVLESLGRLKEATLIVEACSMLANEGVKRATATEIASRCNLENGTDMSPPVVGRVLSAVGLRVTVSSGVKRNVLDPARLGTMQDSLRERLDSDAPVCQELVNDLSELVTRVAQLEDELAESINLIGRQAELRKYLDENRKKTFNFAYLTQEYHSLGMQLKNQESLKTQIKDLREKVEDSSRLEEEKAALEKTISERATTTSRMEVERLRGEQELAALKSRASKSGARLSDIEKLAEAITLTELKLELDDINRQLGEKRTILDRALRRNRPLDEETLS